MSIGLRAYARHRKAAGLAGTTLKSVQVAIAAGRLSKALTKDRKRIQTAEAADREWAATTRVDRIPITGRASARTMPPELEESRARREAAEAGLAEMELAQRRAEFVVAADVESKLAAVFARCKAKFLALPSIAQKRDPSLTSMQVEIFEALIGEATEELDSVEGVAAPEDQAT